MVIFVILAIIVKLVMATNIPYSEQLEWVEGTRVMKTESWKKIIDRSADPAHGCILPALDPWDEEVTEFVSSFPEVIKTND